MESAASQTELSVGPDDDLDLVVVRREVEIVQPRGEHFDLRGPSAAAAAAARRAGWLPDDVFSSGSAAPSSGRKPPLHRGGGAATTPAPAARDNATPARERHPGPLHLHSPGLSPIPSRDEPDAGKRDAAVQQDQAGSEARSRQDQGKDRAGEATVEENEEEEQEEEEEEEEEDDYRLLSVRALDGEFQKSASRDGEGEGVLAGDDENQSLQMLSLLASEASVSMNAPLGAPRRAAAAASATTAAAAPSQAQATTAAAAHRRGGGAPRFFGAGTVFSIALDREGSPVLVPLQASSPLTPQQPAYQAAADASFRSLDALPWSSAPASPSDPRLPTPFLQLRPMAGLGLGHSFGLKAAAAAAGVGSPPLALGSRYWQERLSRRQISSVLASPTLRKFI